MSVSSIIKSVVETRLWWSSYKVFGGFARWGAVSTSSPQLLHVCDEFICMPVRFSEYFYWSDGSGNLVSRIFPNNDEAWDHTNETNPNTSDPYNGSGVFINGFIGYGGYLDLVCGSSKCTVSLVVRRYPEHQILIYNLSSGTVRVNDPPSALGLNKYTTGASGNGYTDLGQNQYVVFYEYALPGIDSSGFFSRSPLGVSKSLNYEFYVPSGTTLRGKTFPTLYTGIKAHKDIPVSQALFSGIDIAAGDRGGVNVAGVRGFQIGGFNVYKDDPYNSYGTWDEGNVYVLAYNGWAEDDNGNVKYVFESGLDISVTTRREEKYRRYVIKLYVVENDEWIVTAVVKPTVDTYSYSRKASTIAPNFVEPGLIGSSYTKSMYMSVDDSVNEVTSAVNQCWVFYDGWALGNFISAPVYGAVGEAAFFIYTDDPNVALPSDARQAFGVGYCSSFVGIGLQVLPFGDRTLSAGKTYAAAVRYKLFDGPVTSDDIANWAKRVYPKVLTSDEWNSLLSTIPFRTTLLNGSIIIATVHVDAPTSVTVGDKVTISGNVEQANANVYVVMYDPSTYGVVASASTKSDDNGNFSVSLNMPSDKVGMYKVMVISEMV
ncbi:MAG: hypothetical protein JHC26_01985 [Thermofilum sp.]|uniref:hypothetical protein n=1 Tax=Thermofilum sp. TaxID=1961369 RepID=UPI0025851172|nr:hypothetical protein [Thermofilum sp.]MCI4407833.1 hypothetical protein [Thermofilum sp.]